VKPTLGDTPSRDARQIREAVTNFLSQQFPSIDFISEKLYWLSLCLFDTQLHSRLSVEATSFADSARAWIATQLGPGLWEGIAAVISKRLSEKGAVIDLADIEAIAESVNAKPEDVHAVLTSLSSGSDPLVTQDFYRLDGQRRIAVSHDEVGRHLNERDHMPDQWRSWAKTIGVTWRRKEET
jgi:hypothetical protein